MINSEEKRSFSITEIIQAQLFKRSYQPLQSACLLFTEALFPMITRYLQRQQINFKASSLLNMEDSSRKRILFIYPHFNENKKNLPRFVLSYLQGLPYCQLFYQLSPASSANYDNVKEGAGFMVEYGFQHPLPVPDITEHLQTKNLYFIFTI